MIFFNDKLFHKFSLSTTSLGNSGLFLYFFWLFDYDKYVLNLIWIRLFKKNIGEPAVAIMRICKLFLNNMNKRSIAYQKGV